MLSLIFEELDGEKIMLPIAQTAFEEKKSQDGSVYVMAYYNQDKFALKTSLNEIVHMVGQAQRPHLQMSPPLNFK